LFFLPKIFLAKPNFPQGDRGLGIGDKGDKGDKENTEDKGAGDAVTRRKTNTIDN
jgi:hypothetical protein